MHLIGSWEYTRQLNQNTLIDAGDARGRRHRDTAGGHEERGVARCAFGVRR